MQLGNFSVSLAVKDTAPRAFYEKLGFKPIAGDQAQNWGGALLCVHLRTVHHTGERFELPTVRVNDAFTRGGAQVAGGQRSFGFNFGSDLDYVRNIHSLRAGIVVDGGNVRADDTSNYLGTYTFESLDAFLAGRPRSYTRRIGDPRIRYNMLQAAVYLQDDMTSPFFGRPTNVLGTRKIDIGMSLTF